MSVLEELANAGNLGGNELTRFYSLLLARRPQELIQRSASDDAAQYVVTHGTIAQALAAVDVRATNQPPVWKKAYTAITALYRGKNAPEISQAFVSVLDANATVGERIAHPEDRNEQLAGSVWFYYGSRYGVYLDEQHDATAEDYLESSLEASPGNTHAYAELADYSAQAGRPQLAITDYRHALELNPDQPAVLDRIADVNWKMGRQADAVASWQAAVTLLAKQMDASPVPQSFWGDTATVLHDTSADGQYGAIRQAVGTMIRAYLQRNGTYMALPLLKAGYQANDHSMEWLLQIVAGVPQEQAILNTLRYSTGWMHKDQRSRLLARVVELERTAAQQTPASSGDQLANDEAAWATALLDEGKTDQARAVLAQVPAEQKNLAAWLAPEIRLAETDKSLPQLIAQWKSAGASAPEPATLRNVAAGLSPSAKNEVMAYVYEQALAALDFSAPNFLGLAEIRLENSDTAGAMQLLHRMVLVSGDVYNDMDSAAALLEKHQHQSEAMQFLQPLSQASPWSAPYKVRLAKATLAVTPHSADSLTVLRSIAADPDAEYGQRAAAARVLKGEAQETSPGVNTELSLLAQSACPTPQQASQSLFVRARVTAAECATNDSLKESLLRPALADAPDNNAIRLLYIWAAFGARQNVRALLAAEPILENSPGYNSYGGNASYAYNSPVPEYRYNGGNEEQGNASAAWLSPSDAGRLYLLVVRAFEERREFEHALSLARQGANLARGAPQESALHAEEKHLQAIVAVEERNEARAPSIHKQIEQDHIVRPRIAEGTLVRQEVSQ